MSLSYIVEGSAMTFFWWVLSGVLQGCHLSGLSFVFILDPLLRAFTAFKSDVRACRLIARASADDIGASMLFTELLAPMLKACEISRHADALAIKGPKCVSIPTGHSFSLHVVHLVKNCLARTVSE